ncbi:hypothetical protein K7I13_12215 [Brucepastera parasyntrophica]|uniref:hypothetical protein n=1 Tax=Brucepastera parasyntrophica TaxID=2880008 RepID=UPI00210C5CA9|nr:hypothetical protein [Brucepastera parasyntrophica]ULQ59250.1 hypothetical protein K7I13_12215 [Brucepastera parasyntrophica]
MSSFKAVMRIPGLLKRKMVFDFDNFTKPGTDVTLKQQSDLRGMRYMKKTVIYIFMIFCLLCCFSGCKNAEKKNRTQEEIVPSDDLWGSMPAGSTVDGYIEKWGIPSEDFHDGSEKTFVYYNIGFEGYIVSLFAEFSGDSLTSRRYEIYKGILEQPFANRMINAYTDMQNKLSDRYGLPDSRQDIVRFADEDLGFLESLYTTVWERPAGIVTLRFVNNREEGPAELLAEFR